VAKGTFSQPSSMFESRVGFHGAPGLDLSSTLTDLAADAGGRWLVSRAVVR
jgi:hypothetical protein